LQFADALFAADLILFVAQLAALVLFFLFARHAMASIPNEGGALSFIRGIVEPTAILLIVVIGQSLLWKVVNPFVSANGKTVYFGVVITLIAAVAFWLVFRAYQQAPHLVDGVQYLVAHFPKLKTEPCHLCNACGGKVAEDAKYCVHCGQKLEEAIKCLNCGQTLAPGQRYCPHCGKGVAA
ncbi:MAG: zinc ribbon domain-containing protein, partial [Methylococcaceae bacterium]|nr:zinc ribbon domain-containing protein [Methylococcaceae bacterium]